MTTGRARQTVACGLLLALALTVWVDIAILVVPIYDMQLYDRVVQSHNMSTLAALSLACGIGLLLYAAVEYLRAATFVTLSSSLARKITPLVIEAGVRAGAAGDRRLGTETLRDFSVVTQFVGSGALVAPLDALCSPILLAVLFMLHPAFGWLALASAAALLLLGAGAERLTAAPVTQAAALRQRVAADLHGRMVDRDLLSGLGMLDAVMRRWRAAQAKALGVSRAADRRANAMTGASRMFRLSVQAGVMTLGAVLIVQGRTSPGALMGANLLLNKFLNPYDHLVHGVRHALLARAAWRRVDAALASIPPAPLTAARADAAPGLSLAGVGFVAGGRQVLEGIDFAAGPGAVVAIAGPNGAGKTTLLRLLVGLVTPTEGAATWDGAPAGAARAGYMPQDLGLLDGTIAENIGRFAAGPLDDVVEAARAAGAHDLIGRLPGGYQTPLIVAAPTLSVGQLQLVALARALYCAPPLLVLDEPDASLDDQGEQALLRAILDVRDRGGIVVLTTHRRRLLQIATQVVTLSAGRLVAPLQLAA